MPMSSLLPLLSGSRTQSQKLSVIKTNESGVAEQVESPVPTEGGKTPSVLARISSSFFPHRRTIVATKVIDQEELARATAVLQQNTKQNVQPVLLRQGRRVTTLRNILGKKETEKNMIPTSGLTESIVETTPQVPIAIKPSQPKEQITHRSSARKLVKTKSGPSTIGTLDIVEAALSKVEGFRHPEQSIPDSLRDHTPSPSTLVPPYNWKQVLQHFRSELTAHEEKEILTYNEIHYLSTREIKKRRYKGRVYDIVDLPVETGISEPLEIYNDGYDDAHGDYLIVPHDHIAYRYEVLSHVGSGSFGQVVCCIDHSTKTQMAIKMIRNRQKYQALIEIQVLLQLHSKGHSNVVRMYDYFTFRNHLCLTFELLGMNLYEYLKLRYFQGIPMNNLRMMATQILSTLAFLKTKHVIHCDLKPENILIRTPLPLFQAGTTISTSEHVSTLIQSICVIDFGSSCLDHATMYTYIQSRFYRSPEVILGHSYDTSIDMWSFGCILVEMHTGHPIFAGETEVEQLYCMLELLGIPPTSFLMKCKRRKHFFEEEKMESCTTFRSLPFTNSRGRKRITGSRPLASVLRSQNMEFITFITKCLIWDPMERMTPEQALQDPWILHKSDVE